MKNFTRNNLMGIGFIIFSIFCFFCFLWWGTKHYDNGYAFGICAIALIFIVGGLITYHWNED